MISKRGTATPFDRVLTSRGIRRTTEASFTNRVVRPFIERVMNPSSALLRNFDLNAVRERLMRGGFPRGLSAKEFLFIKLVLPVLLAIIFWALAPTWAALVGLSSGWLTLGAVILGAIYGWYGPDFWLNGIIRRRQMEIRLALPDMIDLVTVSVEAGLGLDASLQRVASRFPNALSEEVLRAMQEVRLGRSRIEALREMSRRVGVDDLAAWITALVQAELLGVSIANVLRVQSERLREKRSARAREQAQKAPIKMVVPLVFFIFPALFVIILGPALLIAMNSGF